MNKETYEKAKDLNEAISDIQNILDDIKNNGWVKIVTPSCVSSFTGGYMANSLSIKFQNDLIEWMKKQKALYIKEFEEL